MTRVAVLINGEPRFCREFDQFILSLTRYSSVDWYMLLWDRSPQISDYHRSQQSRLVADSWLAPTESWARAKIQDNLPQGHRLAELKLVDQHSLVFPPVDHHDGVTNLANAWKMFWANQQTDQMRRAGHYDLVIKARPDMLSYAPIDLSLAADIVNSRPNQLIMPNNTRAGYGYAVSDLMAMGSSDSMRVYADCYDHLADYMKEGRIFHPETILGWYLQRQQIEIQTMGIRIDIRQLGQRLSETAYISDFGRWA